MRLRTISGAHLIFFHCGRDGWRLKCYATTGQAKPLLYVCRVPSKIADGSQYTTQQVGRTMRSIKPIEGLVDKTCGPISNILGTSSRMLGKTVKNPQEVVFLYGRIHEDLGASHPYQGIVKEVIGYVLTNVILYPEDMADSQPVEIADLPVLSALIANYKAAGATPPDVYHLLKLLSRNGKQDIPKELAEKVRIHNISIGVLF